MRPQNPLNLLSEKSLETRPTEHSFGQVESQISFSSRIRDYALLCKMRLTSLVVFSAVMGFVIATRGQFDLTQLLLLILGGFLVTGSSNAFNQVIERDTDKLMERTKDRPLPSGRMQVAEAFIAAMIMGK